MHESWDLSPCLCLLGLCPFQSNKKFSAWSVDSQSNILDNNTWRRKRIHCRLLLVSPKVIVFAQNQTLKCWRTCVGNQQYHVGPKNPRITSRLLYLCGKIKDFPQGQSLLKQGIQAKRTLSLSRETICHIKQFPLLNSPLRLKTTRSIPSYIDTIMKTNSSSKLRPCVFNLREH